MKKPYLYLPCPLSFSRARNRTRKVVIRDDTMVTVTAPQFKSSTMEIASPTEQDFEVTIKAAGKIDVPPENRAKVTTFVGGNVKSTTLLVGDKVTRKALLTLENTEFLDIQRLSEVAEQIKYLKSEYERQKTLFDEKITSQKNYLKAESDYRVAKECTKV
jgi:cobalt-zinc-cadmium efflux system membrane fusion protein